MFEHFCRPPATCWPARGKVRWRKQRENKKRFHVGVRLLQFLKQTTVDIWFGLIDMGTCLLRMYKDGK